MNEWAHNLMIMRTNITRLMKELKVDKVTSMSRENAKQLVSTKGLTIPARPDTFARLFDEAVERFPFFTS